MNNIILIGYMGAGKTSVGRELALLENKVFMDTDMAIEKRAGKRIRDIFALEGEAYFRDLETKILEEMLENLSDAVISAGGGLPITEKNRLLLKKLGKVIFLKVKAETVMKRLERDTTRPLLQDHNKLTKIKDMLRLRNPIYESVSDMIMETDQLGCEEIAARIRDGLTGV